MEERWRIIAKEGMDGGGEGLERRGLEELIEGRPCFMFV